MAIALLHNWSEDISTPGLFTLHDGKTVPGSWRLKGAVCDPKAFPTPLARAEALRHVLRGGEEAAGHVLAIRFKLLLLGATLDFLQIDRVDLASDEFDNLGRALLRAESDARYLGLLVRRKETSDVCFGASHPDCLFFPHARRSRTDWDELASLVGRQQGAAIRLLCDFRSALDNAGAWDPEIIDWQTGLQWLLGEQAGSPELAELRKSSRLVGPLILRLPTGNPDQPTTLRAVYWPVLAPGYTEKVISYFYLSPPAKAAKGIELRDAVGTSLATIAIPETGENVDPVALGAGNIEMHPVRDVQPPLTRRLWLRGRGEQTGLLELLRPVENALRLSSFGSTVGRASGVGSPVTQAAAQQCPVFFPDPIRIIADMGLWRGEGEDEAVAFSHRCEELTFGPGGPGRLPTPSDLERDGGVVVRMETSSGIGRVAYLDRCGVKDVGDLRALGLLLFLLFTGEAEVDLDAGGIVDDAFTPLLDSVSEVPLEPTSELYARSCDSDEATRLGRRLATLQRFVRSYRSEESSTDLERLCSLAARSLAFWAHGSEVQPMGMPGERTLRYRLWDGGQEIAFVRDVVEPAQFEE